uniref:Protein BEAN1 isoform X2 n=1 Tax=Pogona vitticeps TaxID=103695 RepID=A0ABM5EUV4_9SAUR
MLVSDKSRQGVPTKTRFRRVQGRDARAACSAGRSPPSTPDGGKAGERKAKPAGGGDGGTALTRPSLRPPAQPGRLKPPALGRFGEGGGPAFTEGGIPCAPVLRGCSFRGRRRRGERRPGGPSRRGPHPPPEPRLRFSPRESGVGLPEEPPPLGKLARRCPRLAWPGLALRLPPLLLLLPAPSSAKAAPAPTGGVGGAPGKAAGSLLFLPRRRPVPGRMERTASSWMRSVLFFHLSLTPGSSVRLGTGRSHSKLYEQDILPCKKEELQCGNGLCLMNHLHCRYKKDCGKDYVSITVTCSAEG